jgi:hypothetical protein
LAVAPPTASNELEILRNDLICEIKALNETLADNITGEIIKVIKRSCAKKPR